MKTLRFGLLAILLFAFAAAYSDNDPNGTTQGQYIKISLKDACNCKGLMKAIYNQVDESFLGPREENRLYWAKVRYQRGIFMVYGKYREWEEFFLREGGALGPPDWQLRR